MSQVSLPPLTPLSQTDATWPPLLETLAEGSAWTNLADGRWPTSIGGFTLWDAPTGGGTAGMSRTHNNEVIVGALNNAKTANMGGFPIVMPLTAQAWPGSFRMPEHLRVFRLQWYMAAQGGSPTEQTGLQFIVSAGTVGGWVVAAANTGGFGIVGDGAGNWRFFTKKGAGTYLTSALVMPNAITELVKFEIQMVTADGRGAASLTLLVNDVVVALSAARSSFGAGTELPVYVDGSVANSNKFIPSIQANDGAGITLQIGGVRCISGSFLFDGTQR